MKKVHALLSVTALATIFAATSAIADESTLGVQDEPGVEIRELEQLSPNQFRSPKPLEFTVPEVEALKALPDAKLTVVSFNVSGNTVFSDEKLLSMLEEYKSTITFQELFDAVTELSNFYRDNGYMVARAYVPEQEVSDGIVDIIILEGVLGDVHITGDGPIKTEQVVAHMDRQVQTGIINADDMEYGALLLNDLPGSSASVVLRPGAETGLSDVELEVKDEGRYDFAVDLNNFGTPVTGEYRLGAQVGVNNIFKSGDRFTFRPIVSDTGDTRFGSLGFSMPVFTPGTKVGIRFAHLMSMLGEDFESLEIDNTATIIALNASHAFVRSRNKNIFASFAYEARNFVRECTYCATKLITTIEDADYDLDAVQLAVNGDFRDERWGGGVNTWYFNIRNGLSDVDRLESGTTTPGADRIEGKFTSIRLGGQRLQKINDLWSVSLKLDLQSSSNDLDAAERFGLGGINAVRAYRPSEALGDKGAVLQTEVRYLAKNIADKWDWMSTFQPYFLIDAGSSELNDDANVITRDLTQQRTGWGAGLRVQGEDQFHIDLVAAKRITDRVSIVDQPADDEANFWLQAVYWF